MKNFIVLLYLTGIGMGAYWGAYGCILVCMCVILVYICVMLVCIWFILVYVFISQEMRNVFRSKETNWQLMNRKDFDHYGLYSIKILCSTTSEICFAERQQREKWKSRKKCNRFYTIC